MKTVQDFLGYSAVSQASAINHLILEGTRSVASIADCLHIGKAGGEYPQAHRKNSGRGGAGQEEHKALIGRVKCHFRALRKKYGADAVQILSTGAVVFSAVLLIVAEEAGEYKPSK